jgi:hypothetical protein
MGRSTKQGLWEGLNGVLAAVFPFSAFGGEIGGGAPCISMSCWAQKPASNARR